MSRQSDQAKWIPVNRAKNAMIIALDCVEFDHKGLITYLALCRYAAMGKDPDGSAIVGAPTLARATRLSVAGVRRGLRYLRAEGLITFKKDGREGKSPRILLHYRPLRERPTMYPKRRRSEADEESRNASHDPSQGDCNPSQNEH